MIIDQIRHAGLASYLLDRGQTPPGVNLANAADGGTTAPLRPGRSLDVSAIDLLIEGPNLPALFQRRDSPILTFSVRKELFPGLFDDPYASRVHLIGGSEDLRRGALTNLRCMEVDGVPTLVSVDAPDTSWVSGVYRYPEPMDIKGVAWDLAATRQTPADAFNYSLSLDYWHTGNDDLAPSAMRSVTLVQDAGPAAIRAQHGLDSRLRDVIAYRLSFKAQVSLEAFVHEQHDGASDLGSLGRPLLRSVGLVEAVPSSVAFFSLQEMLLECMGYHLFEEANGTAERLSAQFALSANLSRNESITLHAAPRLFKRVEARVRADEQLRPPKSEQV